MFLHMQVITQTIDTGHPQNIMTINCTYPFAGWVKEQPVEAGVVVAAVAQ